MIETLAYLKQRSIPLRKLYHLVLVFFTSSVISLAQPEVLRWGTIAIADMNGTLLKNTIIFAAVSATLFIFITYLKDVLQRHAINFYQKQLGEKTLGRLIDSKMSVIDKMQFGDVSTVLTQNIERYSESITNVCVHGSMGFFGLIITFLYMCVIEWRLAICVLVYNVIVRTLAVPVMKKIKGSITDNVSAMRTSGNFLSSLLRNMMMVRIYSNRDFIKNRFKRNEEQVMKTGWKSFVWSNGYQDFLWAFSKFAEFAIVYGVGAWLINLGQVDISILLTFVFANDLFTISIINISVYLTSKSEAAAFQKSISAILDEPRIENQQRTKIDMTEVPIRFENVTFGYGDRLILDNVSFQIDSREKVLLKGGNGQGKSTILKLISGLYQPLSGHIYFGDVQINYININEIADKSAYISQHSAILEGNIYENLALSENVDISAANDVLSALNIHGKGGIPPGNLSTGEQQRLNIGRALYRASKKVVLADEIFSNIDEDNKKMVIDAFKKRYDNATVIMITHEEINIRFDKVLEVSGGKVIVSCKG